MQKNYRLIKAYYYDKNQKTKSHKNMFIEENKKYIITSYIF